MNRVLKPYLVGGSLLCVAALLVQFNSGNAGSGASLKKQVLDLSAAVKAGKPDAAKKLAKQIAEKEEEVYYVMLLLKPRTKKGIGFGKGGGKTDGVELKLRSMAKAALAPAVLKTESADLLEMVNHIKAVTLISHQLPPKKDKNFWIDYCKDTDEACVDFEAAVKAQQPQALKTAADKINSACNNCHSKFR